MPGLARQKLAKGGVKMDVLLPTIWFFLWSILWAVYFALDSFDLGGGILAAFLPAETKDKMISSLGPFWDGNEVWLITAAGVTFAAFPTLYAVMFSSLYIPLIIILLSLVFRAVALEFYYQEQSSAWRKSWIIILSLTSFLAPFLFGIAFGNIFQGLAIKEGVYVGRLTELINPYALLTGFLLTTASCFNSSIWLEYQFKEGKKLARNLWRLFAILAISFFLITPFTTAMLNNYLAKPYLFVLPLLILFLLIGSRIYLEREKEIMALLSSCAVIFLFILSCFVGLYPVMLPSTIDALYNITIFNAVSSTYTLKIMLIVTLIFLPLVVIYQTWHYRVFARKNP